MASLKFEIETWAAALEAYDAQDLDLSLDLFSKIADNSKIFTNIGIIHASLGEHEAAVEAFRAATSLDSYLAIAYFQAGVSNFLLGQFDVAFKDFEDAFQVLRGNEAINYEQLGLKYKLHAAAVLFNQGITMINLCDVDRGMQILREAQALKAQDDHDVIVDAIQDRGEGYSVFCIPMGVLYRPNEKKVANMRARDWMGKARLISATNSKDELEAFAGPKRAAPPRPDPPPPQAGLGRSRSAVAPSTVRFADAPRIVRSATTAGNTTLPPRDLMDSLTVTKRPVVVSPLDTSFDSLQSQPPSVPLPLPPPEPLRVLTKSKSLTFRSNEGGMRGPPMARRPTLKVQNVDPIEFPPSPPTSQRSDSVSSETSTKGQRLLDAVEEEERQDRYGKPILPPPANVPEDVETLSMMGDVYDGYLNSGDEDYFGMDKAMSRMGTKSLRRQDSLGNPKVPLPSTIAALPATPKVVVTRPTRSNTLPSPRGSPTMGLGLMNSALDSSASSVSGSSVAFGEDLELQRIRVKLHHRDDIRAMLVAPVISFAELRKRVCDKFEQPLSGMRLKFDDEDGTRMSIRDEEDWEIAIGTARNHMKALGGGLGEGKLTIWCEEE